LLIFCRNRFHQDTQGQETKVRGCSGFCYLTFLDIQHPGKLFPQSWPRCFRRSRYPYTKTIDY